MLKNNLSKVLGLGIIFTLGILAGIFLLVLTIENSFYVVKSISIQVDPTNAASILINVLLVLYVTRILTRKNEEERVEKGILIKRLERFNKNLNDSIEGFLSTPNLKLLTVNAKLKTIRQEFHSIVDLLKKYNFIEEGDNICEDIDTNIRDVKDLLTETPTNGITDPTSIEINQGEISLGTLNRQGVETSSTKIKSNVFDLVVLINRTK